MNKTIKKCVDVAVCSTYLLYVSQWLLVPDSRYINGNATVRTKQRISYTLHPHAIPFLFNNTFNLDYRCNGRLPLPEPIQRLVNFTTIVSTNLKILFMGDSVGMQFAQGFQESAGGTYDNYQVLRYSWGTHVGLTLLAPVLGGGQVAGWRITDMLELRGENKPLPNRRGGGWVKSDVLALLDRSLSVTATHSARYDDKNQTTKQTMVSFDSMVFRIPQGWISPNQVTEQSLQETVGLAHELFGVSTVIFVSLPFVNNYQTMQDLVDRNDANERLHEFAQGWSYRNSDIGVTHVLVLELGRLVDEFMKWNARLMGYDTSDQNYTMDRLKQGKKIPRSIPLVCTERPEGGGPCEPNLFSFDGMHWCMENMNGRVSAGVACLLGCVHNGIDNNKGKNFTGAVKGCEKRCNDQYMRFNQVQLGQHHSSIENK